MLLMCCTQCISKFGKLSSGHRTGKGQFSFQSQRRAVRNNVQTTGKLSSFHVLVSLCSKSFMLGFSSMTTENFQMYKLGFGEAEELEINHQHLLDHRESKGISENIYFYFIDYANAFDYVDHKNCGKFLKRWKYQTMLPVP